MISRSEPERTGKMRAVSDVVAFVLMFSIIISGVGIVSMGGFEQLTEFTNNQQVENSERGLEAAASNLDNLHRNSDTYRQFDLSLGGGNVWYNETEIRIDADDSEIDDQLPHDGEIPVNALEHRFELSSGVTSLAYEGGAMFRTETASPRYRPSMQCVGGPNDDKTIISLVNLTAEDPIDRSGAFASEIALQPTGIPEEAPVAADNQFISFQAELVDQHRVYESDPSGDIEIDVSGAAYPEQWGQYFEDKGWGDEGDDVYSCGGAETVLIRISTIEIALFDRDPVG